MTDQSLSTPSVDFKELTVNLYAVAAVIDDCKWTANALYQSASSSNIGTPHEANKRMVDFSKILFTTLREVSNEIVNLAEAFEKRGEAK